MEQHVKPFSRWADTLKRIKEDFCNDKVVGTPTTAEKQTRTLDLKSEQVEVNAT
jgi:hypothetical protein